MRNSWIERRLGGPAQQGAAQGQAATEEDFMEIVQELAALEAGGKLPEDFDLQSACADPAFASLLLELPAAAAVRLYLAERRADRAEQEARDSVAARMQQRGSLPRMSRAGGLVSAEPDYMSMSGAEFRKLEQQLKQASRNGRTVRI